MRQQGGLGLDAEALEQLGEFGAGAGWCVGSAECVYSLDCCATNRHRAPALNALHRVDAARSREEAKITFTHAGVAKNKACPRLRY